MYKYTIYKKKRYYNKHLYNRRTKLFNKLPNKKKIINNLHKKL